MNAQELLSRLQGVKKTRTGWAVRDVDKWFHRDPGLTVDSLPEVEI